MNKRQTELRTTDLHASYGEAVTRAGLPVQAALSAGHDVEPHCCVRRDGLGTCKEYKPTRLGNCI